MPDTPLRVPLCASPDLVERGAAWVFDLLEHGQPVRAFVLRFEGRVVGYLNRCVHVDAEMDWQPGQFLDSDRRWIVCALHGATYEPSDGRCIAGPGQGRRLRPLALAEQDGQVWWLPGAGLTPAFGA